MLGKSRNRYPGIEILKTEKQVDRRIKEMAGEVIEIYRGRKPFFLTLLHGGEPFAAKLMSSIARQDPSFNPNQSTIIISRYGPGRTPGELTIVAPITERVRRDMQGREVILLDDLIDGGETAREARRHALENGAGSVGMITLVTKEHSPTADIPLVMTGFPNMPNGWLLGSGMNGPNEAHRWDGYIALDLSSPPSTSGSD
jgi:hypoxanthine phosphoribosyltransferase